MKYKTNKPLAVLLCYSASKIQKSECAGRLKEWATASGVTNVTTEKTISVEGDTACGVCLDGVRIFELYYRNKTQTFFGLGYSETPDGEYCGNGIYTKEEGECLAVYITLGKQEGVITYGE